MKISLNTIRKNYGDNLVPNGVDALVAKIGEQLGAVEEVIDLGKKYKEARIVKVVHCWKHENSDHLNVCLIDDGGNTPNVNRDENGLVQVVCGAPNAREGILAVWLAPGTTVPDSIDTEPFVLGARELRGVMSNGMLASLKELGLGDDHSGIIEVDADKTPGQLFGDAYNLTNDVVIEIENKMFTHRPDCFGFLGVAREIAGIQNMPFKSPEWYQPSPDLFGKEADLPLYIDSQLPELVPRFSAITMADVDTKPSPLWLKIELAKVGIKSINNIVDYTNYFMVLTGQPLHAYDYDKVKALSGGEATIVVRHPRNGEEIALLNGKTITPRDEAVMIATDQKLIGIGGIMGGTETEVDENTQNIILECANFDMYNIRKTSMEHGLFTDAVTRFNKGQSPLQTLAVLAKVVDEIKQCANGKVACDVIDYYDCDKLNAHTGDSWANTEIAITPEFINSRLGCDLSQDDIIGLLENVEFGKDIKVGKIVFYPPFWRTDIEIPEDIVEEVGRLYGFDKLKRELPFRSISPVKKDELFAIKSQIRDTLAKSGANEVLTYSFVHGDLLDKVGQDKEKAFKLSNALSPDLQYYRLSLVPSLLDKVHANVKAGYDKFALFEIGKAHVMGEPDPAEPSVPKEVNALSYVYVNSKNQEGSAYYNARQAVESLICSLGTRVFVRFEPVRGADLYDNPWIMQMTAPFEPGRSAVLRDGDGLIWGVVGEFKLSVRKALKLPECTAAFELDPLLLLHNKQQSSYVALPRFPRITQDITLRVVKDTPHDKIADLIADVVFGERAEKVHARMSHLGTFQAEGDTHKNISFRISLASYDKTMREHEVSEVLDAVATKAHEVCGAERV
jgi:phenylalanyl-tRNA synthetase beta chain